MNVPLFMRILAAFILCLCGYYLSFEFYYVLGGLSFASLHQVLGLLWYVFSGITIIHLFRAGRSGWVLGNAWLSYGAFNILSNYIFIQYMVEDVAYSEGNDSFGIQGVMFIFYGVLWFMLNSNRFVDHFQVSRSTRFRSSLYPALVVFSLLMYNIMFYL